MITNHLLEEIWAVKDRLDAESGGNTRVFCEQMREWSAKNLPRNMEVCGPSELHDLLAKAETSEILEDCEPEK
jgi:hypothetical protein